MKNIDSLTHTRGESIYVDDIPVAGGTLHAVVFDSPLAHGKIKSINLAEAYKVPGVKYILTGENVPGENQIGGIVQDEPLLADEEVHFRGQPIALVLATSDLGAREAAHRIKVDIDPLPIVTCPREAAKNGAFILKPRTFNLGDVDSAWANCKHIFEGQADTGGQEHLYIEGQGAYAFPTEGGKIKIVSSTQGPTQVQRATAKVLGYPMHMVEVDVRRLGGGFGGKEDQATAWAALAAVGAYCSRRPVKLILHRMEDMRMTGKRHPYTSDFKIGLDENLKIIAYQASFYQNAGASADLSPAVLERTLFHATNSYFVPNVRAKAHSCRTNLPPNTAFRGFGGPQGMFVIEAAIAKAARALGVDPMVIQERNLLKDGDEFSYGQIAEGAEAQSSWKQAVEKYDLAASRQQIEKFNAENPQHKKGLALMPICFGISFTNTPMNNARALVHVYSDSSIGISTGAVEMGQGVNTKMLQVAAHTFSVNPDRIRVETTNTTRVANTSPTAASAGSDLNGKALQIACNEILGRLIEFAANKLKVTPNRIKLVNETVHLDDKATDWKWKSLINDAFWARINLSAKGHYSTPKIHFDKNTEKGHPFAYHVYGTAITEVTVDCIRGTYEFDKVQIVHDFGQSMNEIIDRGQTEGGLVQGIGWMTMEELAYNKEGRLLSNALSTYKIPDIYSVPKSIDIEFLKAEGSDLAILKSKAVGEPPLMYGIGAYFALSEAIKAFNPNYTDRFNAPMTPERVLMSLYQGTSTEVLQKSGKKEEKL